MDEETKSPEEESSSEAESALPVEGEAESDLEAQDGSGDLEGVEEEEVEFDLEAQIQEFRSQIEEEPDNCIHHYNLGEALEELGNSEEAREEFDRALECDKEGHFRAIIHFGLGNLLSKALLSGIQSIVVKSSVGLHSAHKPGSTITEVFEEDYIVAIKEYEQAVADLPMLKANDEIYEYISKSAPSQIASAYYKWASDLIDKSRQLKEYGGEIKDVQQALKHLKKTVEIDPNHSQANLMVDYAKKMLAEGWSSYDEYGFLAKEIKGLG